MNISRSKVINDIGEFNLMPDLIVTNCVTEVMKNILEVLFSRDLFGFDF
jgi:hypothetical protein